MEKIKQIIGKLAELNIYKYGVDFYNHHDINEEIISELDYYIINGEFEYYDDIDHILHYIDKHIEECKQERKEKY